MAAASLVLVLLAVATIGSASAESVLYPSALGGWGLGTDSGSILYKGKERDDETVACKLKGPAFDLNRNESLFLQREKSSKTILTGKDFILL